ncbi:MAG TPA: hypothetical protein VFF06_03020 [Polyangia bacterium]|nr:hypothetical protein [Polyangia bacterium]
MGKIVAAGEKRAALARKDGEPGALWALAVGLVYVFRTRPGLRIMRELEQAVRKYAADPAALWRLVNDGDEVIGGDDVIDAKPTKELDGAREPERED